MARYILRLLRGRTLQINKSALTGESVAVEKQPDLELPEDAPLAKRHTMAYVGSFVTFGQGEGIDELPVLHDGTDFQPGADLHRCCAADDLDCPAGEPSEPADLAWPKGLLD